MVVNLVNKNEIDNHPDKTLIGDCKMLKEDMLLELLHVKRECNKCTDYLSKLKRIQGEQLMQVMIPSNELAQLIKDMSWKWVRNSDIIDNVSESWKWVWKLKLP